MARFRGGGRGGSTVSIVRNVGDGGRRWVTAYSPGGAEVRQAFGDGGDWDRRVEPGLVHGAWQPLHEAAVYASDVGALPEVGEGRGAESLGAFLADFSEECASGLKAVATNMGAGSVAIWFGRAFCFSFDYGRLVVWAMHAPR